MTLKTYIEQLQKFIDENPSAMDMTVIYAKDDEGNGFQEIDMEPSIGKWDAKEQEFSGWMYEDKNGIEQEIEVTLEHANAVCVN